MYRRIEVGAGAWAREGAARGGGAFQHLGSSLTQGVGILFRRLGILFVREMHRNRAAINRSIRAVFDAASEQLFLSRLCSATQKIPRLIDVYLG